MFFSVRAPKEHDPLFKNPARVSTEGKAPPLTQTGSCWKEVAKPWHPKLVAFSLADGWVSSERHRVVRVLTAIGWSGHLRIEGIVSTLDKELGRWSGPSSVSF